MATPEESLARIEKFRAAAENSLGHQLFATYVAELLKKAVNGPDEEFDEKLEFIFPPREPYA